MYFWDLFINLFVLLFFFWDTFGIDYEINSDPGQRIWILCLLSSFPTTISGGGLDEETVG